MPSPRRIAAALLTLGALAVPSLAHADARTDLALSIAGTWPAQQRPNGQFGDYLNHGEPMGRTRYAESMLGYGLLQTGLDSGRRDLVDAGLRGLGYAISIPYGEAPGGASVFENLAVAAAYNVAARRLAGDPAFEGLRARWEDWLRHVDALHLSDAQHFANKHAVEAVVVLELCRSGIGGGLPGSVLGNCAAARARVDRLLDVTASRAAGARRIGGHDAVLLSDPPVNPLAYHGLTLGMLARAVQLGGGHGPARRLLADMVNASWALTAPDGDLAYVGRSSEQAWALALTAYGAQAAHLAGTMGARADAVTARALQRLRLRHPVGAAGLAITPALGQDLAAGALGVDDYAGAGVYNGLTLVALGWAAAAGQKLPGAGALLADAPGGHVVGSGSDELAVVRSADTWFAIKRQPAHGAREDDLRMDFGLMAFKRRDAAGTWNDVTGPPPITHHAGETAGPVLIRDGLVGRVVGERLSVAGDAVTVVGRFETAGGRVLRDHVRFVFRPVRRAIQLRFPVRRGDRIGLSAFLRAGAARVGGRILGDGTLAFGASAGAHVATEPGYHSGAEPELTRARLALVARRTGPIAFTWQGR